MTEDEIKELLNINDVNAFDFIFFNINQEYSSDIKKWDERLVKHYAKISGMTVEELLNNETADNEENQW